MKLTNKLLQIDPEAIQKRITRFINDYMRKAKAAGIVLGVSGGIDSSTTAALCSIAIDPDKIMTLYMPEKETYNKTDHKHVKELAEKFQFQLKTIDLTDALSTLYKTIPIYNSKDQISKGNLKARTRMIIWYYYANHQDCIVVGSSDKSETMIGYYTKWGDGGADIAPLMDLYKTQVRQLAQHLDIPTAIIQKLSSPNLWPDQKAEEEIGLKYETLDLILYGLEHFVPIQTIAKQLNLPTKTIATIKNKWLQTEHKRRMPLTPKLEYRTINADFRFPLYTQGNAK